MLNALIILNGCLFVLGVVSGIGPQNLNIIVQGVKRNYAYTTATVSFLADFIVLCIYLVFLHFLVRNTLILKIIAVFGILFLIYFIFGKIKQLTKSYDSIQHNKITTIKQAAIRAIGLSFINPLVWADFMTVAVMATAQKSHIEEANFIVGCFIGDLIWMYGLTSLCVLFSDKMNHPKVWRILDILSVLLLSFALYKIVLHIFINH
jgi:L-lysine exporter family protein LysE/ArgO